MFIQLTVLFPLFLGGLNDDDAPLDTTEIYRALLGKFIPGPQMDIALSGACLIKVDESRYVLTGGEEENGNFVVTFIQTSLTVSDTALIFNSK